MVNKWKRRKIGRKNWWYEGLGRMRANKGRRIRES